MIPLPGIHTHFSLWEFFLVNFGATVEKKRFCAFAPPQIYLLETEATGVTVFTTVKYFGGFRLRVDTKLN